MAAEPGFKITPVIQQYLEIKRDHEDAFLFFRLGDFYEMFFEDAERASALLDITLTTRNRNEANPIPLCGVPYHSARPYIAKLVEAGFKVAICEQVDLPGAASKLAPRRVTKVITPGTAMDEEILDQDVGRYLAAVDRCDGAWGLAWTDFSTGEVMVCEFAGPRAAAEELQVLDSREIVIGPGASGLFEEFLPASLRTRLSAREFAHASRDRAVKGRRAAAAALGGLYEYLSVVQGEYRGHLRPPILYDTGAFLRVDQVTRDNLEVLRTRRGVRKGSLAEVVDGSVTPMGRRLIGRWLSHPLAVAPALGERLDAVEFFVETVDLRTKLRSILKSIGDLERLIGRVGSRNAGPREIVALAGSLKFVGELRAVLETYDLPEVVAVAAEDLDPLVELQGLIQRAIVDEPPATVRQGGVIRECFDSEADRVRSIANRGRGWIAEMETKERLRTGIPTLKVGYNKVFGYYLEVGKARVDRVPQDYERKQTLTNAERYVTPELKQHEGEVLGAQERLLDIEGRLFERVLDEIGRNQTRLAQIACALAVIDAWSGLAESAHRRSYVRPYLSKDGALDITEGRHPVVESVLGRSFVANDTRLGGEGATLAVITGPNMAGKSTYLRQTALIVLLAHAGCFVPAASARIPLCDRIFTRIGASDDLAGGRSTFMVEMSETAHILANMSERSLVVLDEIGRGTSTYDGISIAWAVAEALVAARVKTLFATHYHELAALAEEHEAVENLSVAVKRYRGEVVFLYRVLRGSASGSYGIDVAKLAGLPDDVIERAVVLLERLQIGGRPHETGSGAQLALFGAGQAEAGGKEHVAFLPPVRDGESGRVVLDALRGADLEHLTPIEAMNLLSELVGKLGKEG